MSSLIFRHSCYIITSSAVLCPRNIKPGRMSFVLTRLRSVLEEKWRKSQCHYLSSPHFPFLTHFRRFVKCRPGTGDWTDEPREAKSVSESVSTAAKNAGLPQGTAYG